MIDIMFTFAGMYPRGRGTTVPYRGRGTTANYGRGKRYLDNIQFPQLIASSSNFANMARDSLYEEFLAYKQQKAQSEDNYAKIVGNENKENPIAEFAENDIERAIIILENKDLKWENDPYKLMERYFQEKSDKSGTYKFQQYYEHLLMHSGSCEITHFTSGAKKDSYNFSKIIIKNIISIEEWGISPFREKNFSYPHSEISVKYNYWDYIQAFDKVLLYENENMKHSWFIKICSHVYDNYIPNWFWRWCLYYGPMDKIIPGHIKTSLYDEWKEVTPAINKCKIYDNNKEKMICIHFFMEFSIPWIWKWIPRVGNTEDNFPCLKRISLSKFWDKMTKINPETQKSYAEDTVSLIEKKISIYKAKKEYEESLGSRSSGQKSKQQIIEEHIEKMKQALMDQMEETSNSQDELMQDSQDPNEVDIEDLFGAIRDTLKEKLRD